MHFICSIFETCLANSMLLDQEGTWLCDVPLCKLRLADRRAAPRRSPGSLRPTFRSFHPNQLSPFPDGPWVSRGPRTERPRRGEASGYVEQGQPVSRARCLRAGQQTRGDGSDPQGRPGSFPPRDAQLRAAGCPYPAEEQPTPRGRSVSRPEVGMTARMLSPASSDSGAQHTGPAFWRS